MKTNIMISILLILSLQVFPSHGSSTAWGIYDTTEDGAVEKSVLETNLPGPKGCRAATVAEGRGGLTAQDAGKILSQCIDVLGGEEAVRRFSDYRAEGDVKFTMYSYEFPGKIDITQKGRKSRARFDLEFGGRSMTLIRAFDGKVAWQESRGSVSDSPSLNDESNLAHTIAILLDKQADFSIDKETEIEGKKAIGIVADVKGKKTTFFIDKEKHMLLEILFKDTFFGDKDTKEVVERRIRYEDYREFDGFLFPMKTTIYQKGEKQSVYNFEKVTFNPTVSASLFKRPDKKPDLRYYEERVD